MKRLDHFAQTRRDHRSRREILAGIGALGVAAAAWPASLGAQPALAGSTAKIDVHHHLVPPRYQAANQEHIVKELGASLAALSAAWTPGGAIERMDKAGVAVAFNSITSPGVWFNDGEAARDTARICNDYGAQLMRDFPGRFGMFAAIPLPDAEGSLREIEYALDVLKLDGIGLLTSYDGKLLGDPAFAPVFDELNRRKTIVFVHPTLSCCGNTIPGVGNSLIEFPMDTLRTITSLLVSGSFARYADIRFIFSHGGGVLVPVVNRVFRAVDAMTPEERQVKAPKGPQYELARQYYDLASIALTPAGMAGLRKLFPTSQLLYGSDEPFGSTEP
jgi:predicted TIM-barrel fold metal-dependent hydrolase